MKRQCSVGLSAKGALTAILIANYQIPVDFGNFLGNQTELGFIIRIILQLECHRA